MQVLIQDLHVLLSVLLSFVVLATYDVRQVTKMLFKYLKRIYDQLRTT